MVAESLFHVERCTAIGGTDFRGEGKRRAEGLMPALSTTDKRIMPAKGQGPMGLHELSGVKQLGSSLIE
jgi:hypothetical protein